MNAPETITRFLIGFLEGSFCDPQTQVWFRFILHFDTRPFLIDDDCHYERRRTNKKDRRRFYLVRSVSCGGGPYAVAVLGGR